MSTTKTRTRPRTRRKAAAAHRKTRAPAAKPAARPAKKSKSAVDVKIKTLMGQLKRKEGSIEQARKDDQLLANKREEARGQLLRLTSEKKNLQEAINAVNLQRKELEAEREAAEADLKALTAQHVELSRQVRKDKRFAAIRNAVAAVEADIKEQRDRVEEQVRTVAAAQRDADKADAMAGELEAARRSKQDELRSLPHRVSEARGQLTKLFATMKAAVAGGRVWEAHSLEGDFELAVKNVREQIDRKQETAVVGGVLASGKEGPRRRVETTARKLSTAKDKLIEEKTKLQKMTQERQKRIREKLEPASK
jgi:chromosome segregation ATPase